MSPEDKLKRIGSIAQSTLEYTVLFGVIVASLVAMEVYLKRGMQGRLRAYAGQLTEGMAYSPGATIARSTITRNVTEGTNTIMQDSGSEGRLKISESNVQINQVTNRSEMTLNLIDEPQEGGSVKLTSTAFENNGYIPKKFTADGENVNPSIEISNIPEGTQSLALIVDDPDAPMGTWVHWVVFNIPVTSRIEENSIPGKQGVNDFGMQDYGGPSPPSGTHRYFFKIYALDTELDLPEGITKQDLEEAMQGHILSQTELIGLYSR